MDTKVFGAPRFQKVKRERLKKKAGARKQVKRKTVENGATTIQGQKRCGVVWGKDPHGFDHSGGNTG